MSKLPRRKRDWIGLAVRSLRRLVNQIGAYPAGTRWTVENNHGGLTLSGDVCPHCGVRPFIRRVPETDVEIIEPEA